MAVIISDKSGQLGNRLIVFANVIANAMKYQYSVLNPGFDEYSDYFERTAGTIIPSYSPSSRQKNEHTLKHRLLPKSQLRTVLYYIVFIVTTFLMKTNVVHSRYHDIFTPSDEESTFDLKDPVYLTAVQRKKIVCIRGWLLRDRVHFSAYSEQIRDYFVPVKKHRDNINKLILKIRGDCDILVGIHIRRGDYKEFLGGRYYYDLNTYQRLMKEMVALLPGKSVHFLICSNDRLDSNQFKDIRFTFGLNHELEDMYSFAKCDYLIGPPSTYTMWASFYGKVPLCMINDPQQSLNVSDFVIAQN